VRASVAAILGTALLGGCISTALAADELDEVQVTGSRIKRASDFDTANPTTVVDADFLNKMGIVNVADAMMQIPSNISVNTPSTTGSGNFFIGSTIVDLRGLNPYFGSRTLNLVDGQRFVPTTQGDGVDLNFIPTILVEHMDVVTGGASAAYGSGAIAGVANISLNHKLDGGKVELDYGESGHSDGKSRHAAAAFGAGFDNDRGHFVVAYEGQKSDAIGCQTARSWCAKDQAFINNPAYGTGTGQSLSAPQYIVAQGTTQFGVTSGGTIIGFNGTNYAANAAGNGYSALPAITNGVAGYNNLVVGGGFAPAYEVTNLTSPVDRNVLTALMTFKVTDTVNLKVDASWGQTEIQNYGSPVHAEIGFLAPNNPYLAAVGAPAAAAFPGFIPGIGGDTEYIKDWTSQTPQLTNFNTAVSRISVGLDGKFGDSSWTWNGYYQFGQTNRSQYIPGNFHVVSYGNATNVVSNPANLTYNGADCAVNVTPPSSAFGQTIAHGCVPVNVFGTAALNPQQLNYMTGYLLEDLTYVQNVVAFNTQGDLAAGFGAGAIKGAAGIELRREDGNNLDLQANVPPAVQTDYLIQYGNSFSGKVQVMEAYAEVDVPVLRDAPGAKLLDFDFSMRESNYKNTAGENTPGPAAVVGGNQDFGGSASHDLNTWKINAIWDPVDWLRVRGSQSRDARAANFRELYYGQTIYPGGIFGYCALISGNQQDACQYNLQGNPKLKPETSDTTTVGLVFTPRDVLPGFQFAADYFHIKVSDAIEQASTNQVLQGCLVYNVQSYCNQLQTVGGATPQLLGGVGVHAGAGNITAITALAFNGAAYNYSGIDFTGSYHLDVGSAGRIDFRLLATHALTQTFNNGAGGGTINILGQTGTSNTFLADNQSAAKWTGNFTASWTDGPFNLTGTSRYVSSGTMNYLGCVAPCQAPVGGATMSTNTVPQYIIFGLKSSYTFDNVSFAKTLQLWGSIDNLFDKSPPFAGGTGFGTAGWGGTQPIFYDTIGRYFRVGVRATF
jgi:outer membrane receptor protein involved in Fe transport